MQNSIVAVHPADQHGGGGIALAAPAVQGVPVNPTVNPHAPDILPEGWATASDPATGNVYFYHAATGATSWERPTEPNAGGAVDAVATVPTPVKT